MQQEERMEIIILHSTKDNSVIILESNSEIAESLTSIIEVEALFCASSGNSFYFPNQLYANAYYDIWRQLAEAI